MYKRQKLVGWARQFAGWIAGVLEKLSGGIIGKFFGKIIDQVKSVIDIVINYYEKKRPKFDLFGSDAYGGGDAGGGDAGGGKGGEGGKGGKLKTPRLTAGETALAGLTKQIENLSAAARIGAVDNEGLASGRAKVHEQAKGILVSHAKELEGNKKLLDSINAIIGSTKKDKDSTDALAKSRADEKAAADKLKEMAKELRDKQIEYMKQVKQTLLDAGKAAVDKVCLLYTSPSPRD